VDPAGSTEILAYMGRTIAERRQAVVLHVNVFGANLALRHAWLREYFGSVQMVFCDGDGIRWGLRILGEAPPPKTTYNVFLWSVARWAEESGARLFLLGGRPGIAERAASRLRDRHPRLLVAGTHHGFFDRAGADNERVVAEINRARPDVLLVCFGMPVQEAWVRDNAARLAVHVVLTGGAALDYGAGVVRVPPGWVKRFQIEWLFRLLMEPRRMMGRYVVGNPLFLGRVLAARIRGRAPSSRRDPSGPDGSPGGSR
jgi:N-acetylglucosaminyldiphosphoundecaprenol N-acetyl-beta-D-mannosaminyltransferase